MLTDQLYARAELYCGLHVPTTNCVCMGEAALLREDYVCFMGNGV
jgi:hypothetical protein